MIELRRSGVVADPHDVDRLKTEFAARDFVLLPKLLEPALLEALLAQVEGGQWQPMVHDKIGAEVVLVDLLPLHVLQFVANSASFLDTVQRITRAAELSRFDGRLYRFAPASGHYDSWHDDVDSHRLVGMSLNLSPRGYRGGLFQLRDTKSKRILVEYANLGFGDATLFRISGRLQHQVTEVEGEEPRTAFAGWFQTGRPRLIATLRSRFRRPQSGLP